jgi:hypothetical protein
MRAQILFGVVLLACVLVSGCHKTDKPVLSLLRVVDRRTGEPIQGARIVAFCGIPGDTNHFSTDRQGMATLDLRSFPGYAQIRADGYVTTNITVRSTNATATFLERAQ